MVNIFLVWVVIIVMFLGLIGGAMKIYSGAPSWSDVFSIVTVIIVLVVFITIAFSGSFIL